MATAPVENPGLIPEEQIYTGTVKHNINPNTGYGFVQDDTVTMMSPAWLGRHAYIALTFAYILRLEHCRSVHILRACLLQN